MPIQDGVGDTADSYAYDGSRVCKWNDKVHRKYGEVSIAESCQLSSEFLLGINT